MGFSKACPWFRPPQRRLRSSDHSMTSFRTDIFRESGKNYSDFLEMRGDFQACATNDLGKLKRVRPTIILPNTLENNLPLLW